MTNSRAQFKPRLVIRAEFTAPFDNLLDPELGRVVNSHHEIDNELQKNTQSTHFSGPCEGSKSKVGQSRGKTPVFLSYGLSMTLMVALSEADAESWKNLKFRSHDPALRFTDESKTQYGDVRTLRQIQHRLTENEIAVIRARRTQGATLKDIAIELNCHRHAVSQHLQSQT